MMAFKDIEEMYLRLKKVHDLKVIITSFRCPVCGHHLSGRIGDGEGDTLDFRAFIYCKGCGMFNAESSKTYSMYERGNIKAEALEDVIEKVRPYIKAFGSPIEEEEE
jgi:hypothetical protein